MKKSKKDIISIRKFMECYLEHPYERRPLTKKQRRAQEELEIKDLLGIEIPIKERKRLKKMTKFVLTHKGMCGYLYDHNYKIPKKVSFKEAEHQDYDGKRYVYVRDDTDTVMPYVVPHPLLEKSLEYENILFDKRKYILKNRISTLREMAADYKLKGDIDNYLTVRKLLFEAKMKLDNIFLEEQTRTRKKAVIDYDNYDGPIEKENRNTIHDRIYSYGRRK